jgi:enoyl-CoA hydratase
VNYQYILVEARGAIAIVTINRPKALNALNSATLAELGETLTTLAGNSQVRVVVLTGSGEKAFVAGADVTDMLAMSPVEARAFAHRGATVFSQLENLPQPVIAAVNGFALGGGCELAMACDIRIAAETAKFAQPETGLGITPGFGGTQRLPRLIGQGRAMELLFTGDTIDAAEALRIGLVNKVVPACETLAASIAMAEKIAARGNTAICYTKAAVRHGRDLDLSSAIAYEAEIFALCFTDPDQARRMEAFVKKQANPRAAS